MAKPRRKKNKKNPGAFGGGRRRRNKGGARRHHRRNPFLGLPLELKDTPAFVLGIGAGALSVPFVTDLVVKPTDGLNPLRWLSDAIVTAGEAYALARFGLRNVALGVLGGGGAILIGGIIDDVTGNALVDINIPGRGVGGVHKRAAAPLPAGGDSPALPPSSAPTGNAKGMGWRSLRGAAAA
jgi:hypothetical protein